MIDQERINKLTDEQKSILITGTEIGCMLDLGVPVKILLAALEVARIITEGRPENLDETSQEEQLKAPIIVLEKILEYVEGL